MGFGGYGGVGFKGLVGALRLVLGLYIHTTHTYQHTHTNTHRSLIPRVLQSKETMDQVHEHTNKRMTAFPSPKKQTPHPTPVFPPQKNQQQQVAALLARVIVEPPVKQAAVQLIAELVQDEEVRGYSPSSWGDREREVGCRLAVIASRICICLDPSVRLSTPTRTHTHTPTHTRTQIHTRNTQVYAVAVELVNRVLAEESVRTSVNALLLASSHKAGNDV